MSGYVTIEEDVRVSDIIDEVDDEDLVEEIKKRGLESKFANKDETKTECDYYKLCDYFGKNYYTKIEELLSLIEGELRKQTKNLKR